MAALSLEGKPWYFGLVIGLVLAIAIVWAASSMVISDIDTQIAAAEVQLKDLDTKNRNDHQKNQAARRCRKLHAAQADVPEARLRTGERSVRRVADLGFRG